VAELLLDLAERHTRADLVHGSAVAEVARRRRRQPAIGRRQEHARGPGVAIDQAPGVLPADRANVAPLAEQVAGRRDAGVGGQPAEITDELGADVDELRAVRTRALLEVDRADGALDLVDVARAQVQHLGQPPAQLPQRFEQEPVRGRLGR
jgi:hypothetical protein